MAPGPKVRRLPGLEQRGPGLAGAATTGLRACGRRGFPVSVPHQGSTRAVDLRGNVERQVSAQRASGVGGQWRMESGGEPRVESGVCSGEVESGEWRVESGGERRVESGVCSGEVDSGEWRAEESGEWRVECAVERWRGGVVER